MIIIVIIRIFNGLTKLGNLFDKYGAFPGILLCGIVRVFQKSEVPK